MLHSYVFLKKAFCTRYFTFYLSCLLFILYKTKRLKLKHMWPWLSIACRARENEKYTSMQFCICCWWRSQRNKKKNITITERNWVFFFHRLFSGFSMCVQCCSNCARIHFIVQRTVCNLFAKSNHLICEFTDMLSLKNNNTTFEYFERKKYKKILIKNSFFFFVFRMTSFYLESQVIWKITSNLLYLAQKHTHNVYWLQIKWRS